MSYHTLFLAITLVIHNRLLQEEYKHKDSLGRLKCGHDFHAGCIKKWLEVKNACPVCKADAANNTT
jgi:hypothetical protein